MIGGTLHWMALPVQQGMGEALTRPATSGRGDYSANCHWLLATPRSSRLIASALRTAQEATTPYSRNSKITRPTALPPSPISTSITNY